MRVPYFFDTEFNENPGEEPVLISIGLVNLQGESYYAVSRNFEPDKCNDWVKKNILPTLPPPGTWKDVSLIAKEIYMFITDRNHQPEFWAYFCAYDWYLFCKMHKTMLNLPVVYPQYCMDLKNVMYLLGLNRQNLPLQAPETVHNALDDAKWVREGYLWIKENYPAFFCQGI